MMSTIPYLWRNRLQRVLAPTDEAIEAFCWDFQQWLGPVPARDAFVAELILREALANASVHGCRSAPAGAKLRCRLRRNAGYLSILVADPGPGFNWRERLHFMPESAAASGRGMEIYRNYAQRIRFNQSGNLIALWVGLSSNSQELENS